MDKDCMDMLLKVTTMYKQSMEDTNRAVVALATDANTETMTMVAKEYSDIVVSLDRIIDALKSK